MERSTILDRNGTQPVGCDFTGPEQLQPTSGPDTHHSSQPRWDLAFFGIVAYLIVEYTRLPYRFPALQPLHVSKIAAAVSAVGLLISPKLAGKDPAVRRIDLAILFLMVAAIFSACFADYSTLAWRTLTVALKWGVVYFLISRTVTSPWRLRIFVFLFLLLNLKLAQLAIRSYVAYGNVALGGESVAMVGAGTTDFFGNSNDFGVAMCVAWPLAAALFLGERKTFSKLVLLVCFLGIFLAMLLSGCRGALVGASAVVLTAGVKTKRKFVAFILGLLIVLGTLYLLPEGNRQRIRSAFNWETDFTASLRIRLWKAGLKMFWDHPVTGVGPGNFPPNYVNRYFGSDPFPYPWYPHSIYMQVLAELGLGGILPALALWSFSLGLNSRTRKHLQALGPAPEERFEYRLALGLELALLAFLVCGSFLTILYYPHFWFLLGLSAGLHAVCTRKSPERQVSEGQEPEPDVVLAAN